MNNKGEILEQKSKRLSIDLQHQNAVRENPASINVSLQPVHSDSIQYFQISFHMLNILRCTSLDNRE